MQRTIRTFWPFVWLLLVWIYVVPPFSFGSGVDMGKNNESPVPLLFTELLVVHACLYAFIRLWGLPRRWYWVYVVVQGGVVMSMSLSVSSANTLIVSGSLFLAFIAESVSFWHTRGPVTLTVMGSVLFFILGIVLRGGWTTFHHVLLYLVPVLLVAIGYILLYLKLAQAHEQMQSLLVEREGTHDELKKYAVRVENLTLAHERQRMARELHDTLAQGLVGLTLQLDTVDALMTENNWREAQEIIQLAMTRSRTTLAAARCAIDDLRGEMFEHLTCSEAVLEEIHRFTTSTGIVCHTDLAVLTMLPSASHEHALRVVAEGLMNILRHAQAQCAWVYATQQDSRLMIEIGDDGIGFDPNAVLIHTGHYGLLGLRERARLIGGHLEIKSAPDMGTRVCFFFPLDRNEGERDHVERTYLTTVRGREKEGRA